jgi:hypothetical protein
MKRLITMALIAFATIATATSGRAASELDFTVVNKTGYGIAELYVAPSAQTTWNDNLLSETLEHNEEVEVTFEPQAASVTKWDIMITFVDDDSKVYWKGYKLAEISKITLKYNRESGVTSAATE